MPGSLQDLQYSGAYRTLNDRGLVPRGATKMCENVGCLLAGVCYRNGMREAEHARPLGYGGYAHFPKWEKTIQHQYRNRRNKVPVGTFRCPEWGGATGLFQITHGRVGQLVTGAPGPPNRGRFERKKVRQRAARAFHRP